MRVHWVLLLFLASCAQPLLFTSWDDGLPREGEWRTNLAISDVNGDGLLDIAGIPRKGPYGTSIWLNNGNGTWTLSTNGILEDFECGVGVDFTDINNDNKVDIALARHCGGPAIYLNNGTWIPHSTGLPEQGVNAISFADFNNDGNYEIVTLDDFGDGFRIHAYSEQWYNVTTNLPTDNSASGFDIQTPDLNNDNLPDIISTGGELFIFINNDNFTFTQTPNMPTGLYYYLAIGDVNNDGLQDIAINGQDLLLLTQPNWDITNLTGCEKGRGVAFGDITGNGQLELAANCQNGINIYSETQLIETNLPIIPETPNGIQLADLNNDGQLDIIAAYGTPAGNQGTGGIYVYTRQ